MGDSESNESTANTKELMTAHRRSSLYDDGHGHKICLRCKNLDLTELQDAYDRITQGTEGVWTVIHLKDVDFQDSCAPCTVFNEIKPAGLSSGIRYLQFFRTSFLLYINPLGHPSQSAMFILAGGISCTEEAGSWGDGLFP
jgi:hypothetical protein